MGEKPALSENSAGTRQRLCLAYWMTQRSPFRYFATSPEVILLAVMLYVRFTASLRNVEDLLHERGIGISHETVRFWWQRLGLICAAEIRSKRVNEVHSSWL